MPKYAADSLLQNTLNPVEWFVPGWLIAGQLNLLAGEVAAGKSFAALDLALGAAARGTAWGGLTVRRAKVLYLTLDTPMPTVAMRLEGLTRQSGLSQPPQIVFDDDYYNLGMNDAYKGLLNYVRQEHIGLLVVDALSRYMMGVSENSTARTTQAFASLGMLTRHLHCTVLVLHHLNKSGLLGESELELAGRRIRGSSNIFASVDCALLLTRRGSLRTLRCIKNRLASEPEPLHFEIKGDSGALSLDFSAQPESLPPSTSQQALSARLLALLRAKPGQPHSRAQLLAGLEGEGHRPSEITLQRTLTKLENFGVETRFEGHRKVYWVRE